MKQLLEIANAVPYMKFWTFAIAVVLFVTAYRIWRFAKMHPEIFQPDTTADNPRWLLQKFELRHRYNNKLMLSVLVILIWLTGFIAFFARLIPVKNYLYLYALPFVGMLLICLINYNHKK